MLVYKKMTEAQKKYYSLWAQEGKNKNLNKTFQEKYINTVETHKQLHPYQFINEDSVVLIAGGTEDLVELGVSQPIIFSTIAKKVILIEPDLTNVNKIKTYCVENNINNLEVLHKAVWGRKSKLKFDKYLHAPAANMVSKLSNIDNDNVKKITVKADSLNNICKKYNDISFVHLTINGAEEEAVKGASKLIKAGVDFSIPLFGIPEKPLRLRRLSALERLRNNGYFIGWTNACPRPWATMNFPMAIATKNIDKLEAMNFVPDDTDF